MREFVAFLQKLNKAYAPSTAIKLILDNHSAHLQGNQGLARNAARGALCLRVHAQSGSSLNLVEGFFSKHGPSAVRQIRVASNRRVEAKNRRSSRPPHARPRPPCLDLRARGGVYYESIVGSGVLLFRAAMVWNAPFERKLRGSLEESD